MGLTYSLTSGDRVSLGDVTAARFLAETAWTVLAFARVVDTNDGHQTILSKGWSAADNRQITMRIDQGGTPEGFEVYHNSSLRINTGQVVANATWYLYALTCSGAEAANDLKLYIAQMDGTYIVDAGTGTTAGNDDVLTANVEIGRLGNNSDFFKGDIANVAYINQELSKAQITAYLRHPLRTALSFGTDLAFFLPLGYSLTTEPDWSGNGNHGTVTQTGITIGPNPPVPMFIGLDTPWVSAGGAAEGGAPTPAVQDDITVTDTPNVALFQSIYLLTPADEAVTVTDTPTLHLSKLFATVSDAVTVGDEVTPLLPQLFASGSDAVTVGEDHTELLPELFASGIDAVTVGEPEVTAFVFPLFIDLEEAVTVADPPTVEVAGEGEARTPSATDAVTVNEVVGLHLSALFIDLEDAITVTDTPNALTKSALTIDVQEDVTVGEAATGFVSPLFTSVQDDITVGEDIDELITALQIVANEAVTVGEDPTMRVPFLGLDVAETVTVAEDVMVARFAGAFVLIDSVVDTVTVGESVTVRTGGNGRTNDDIAAIRQRYRIVGERRYGDKRRIKP
jgi:hypothetical protein